MQEATSTVENDALVAVILQHGPSGRVNSREGWVECLCDERLHLPSGLTFDGYAEMFEEEEQARAEHLAAAIRRVILPEADDLRPHVTTTSEHS